MKQEENKVKEDTLPVTYHSGHCLPVTVATLPTDSYPLGRHVGQGSLQPPHALP